MTDAVFERDRRTHFTGRGLTPAAVLELRRYSRMEIDFVYDGERAGYKCLLDRKLCDHRGVFKIDRAAAQSLVTQAYREGWHENYKV